MSEFITRDSGHREDFASGARRDTEDGKPCYDLLPVEWLEQLALRAAASTDPDERLELLPIEPLFRLAALFGRGAKKYGLGNYEKGIPFRRVWRSLARHVFAYLRGDRAEDHNAATSWNAFALMFYEEQIKKELLPASLDDLPGHETRYPDAINPPGVKE